MENEQAYRIRVALGLTALLLGLLLGGLLLQRLEGKALAQRAIVITAQWDGSKVRVAWTDPGCVWRYPEHSGRVRIGCYDGPGEVLLPDGPDWTRYPRGGDRYTLQPPISGDILGLAILERLYYRMPLIVKAPEE